MPSSYTWDVSKCWPNMSWIHYMDGHMMSSTVGGPIYWKPKTFKMNVLVKHEMFQTLVQYELNSPINHIIHHMADLKSVQLIGVKCIGVKCRDIPYMMSALLTLNDTCFKKVGSLQNPTSSTLGLKRVSKRIQTNVWFAEMVICETIKAGDYMLLYEYILTVVVYYS